ncbi:MAG: DUF5667 domain-containing protein [Nocardioides sp.]
MPSVFASRRRADEFAALVDGATTDAGERYARLLVVVDRMQSVPAPAPRSEFAVDLRSRLLAEADTVLVPTAARERAATENRLSLPPAARTSRDRRVALGLGSLAFVGAAASVTIGAQVALPGDTLYPVKRALEGVRTELAVGDQNTGTLMLAHASERLEETAALTRRTEIDTPATETGLRDFTEQAEGAADLLTTAYADSGEPDTIVDLRDFTGQSMERLAALEPGLPDGARDELYAAADAVVAIDDEAAAACPTCGGTGIDVLPPNLVASAPSAVGPATLPEAPVVTGGGSGRGGSPVPVPSLPTLAAGEPTALPTLPSGPLPTGLPTAAPTLPLPTSPLPSAPLPTVNGTPTPRLPLPSITSVLPTVLPTVPPTILPTVDPTDPLTILPSVTLLPVLGDQLAPGAGQQPLP